MAHMSVIGAVMFALGVAAFIGGQCFLRLADERLSEAIRVHEQVSEMCARHRANLEEWST